ncbi:unnamed protein product [Arabidopsis thaliana]|uniref:Uncharacterized protein n=1 Tax=Arabidopsis thaliana TaxID=3702 RepID=A0A5S9XWQ5_ARATH|nr:unnamed protein product [Arabidopsis thaliana]
MLKSGHGGIDVLNGIVTSNAYLVINLAMHAFSSGVDYFADKEDVSYCDLVPPAEPLLSIMKEIPPLR